MLIKKTIITVLSDRVDEIPRARKKSFVERFPSKRKTMGIDSNFIRPKIYESSIII